LVPMSRTVLAALAGGGLAFGLGYLILLVAG
jgi:hypothetical protein